MSNIYMLYIGMDVHKDMCQVAHVTDEGEVVEKYKMKTNLQSLDNFVRKIPRTAKIVMEASTVSKPVYKHLRKAWGLEVHMANPKKVRQIAESKKKTDKHDSIILAHLLRLGYLPECYVPDEDIETIRMLVRHRASLGKKSTMVKNQIHAILTFYGITHKFSDLFGRGGIMFLKSLKLSPDTQQILNSCFRQLGLLKMEIENIQTRLAEIARENKQAKLLMTIPGVNYYSALAITSEIGDINRFPSAKKLTAHAGLVPRVHQTSKTKYFGHITKEGPSILRWILVSDAKSAINAKDDGKLRRFYLRVMRRRGRNKAVVATARKLLIIMYHMLKDGREYEERDDDLTYRKISAMMRRTKGHKSPKMLERMEQLKRSGTEMLISSRDDTPLTGIGSFS